MKTSKPFAFVLWTDGPELPLYCRESLAYMEGFRWMHYIRHQPEPEPAPLICRVKPKPPKPHWHCVAWFDRATDYQSTVEFIVRQWAKNHPQDGECPVSHARTHEGKVLNLSAWLAYVIHEPRYMQWLELRKDKPESHKTAYEWSDIQSTDDETLDSQCQNALAWIGQTVRQVENFEEAKQRGATTATLGAALRECENYHQMQVAALMFRARHIDQINSQAQAYEIQSQNLNPKKAEPLNRPDAALNSAPAQGKRPRASRGGRF